MATTISRRHPSEPSLIAKFFYRTICTRCAPEDIRIDQAIDQQIAADLLYAYDPHLMEVGKRISSHRNSISIRRMAEIICMLI